MDKPIAWYDPSNGMVSTDKDCPLFTPLGQVWGLYLKEEESMTQTEALRLALEALEYEAQKGNDNAYQFEREAIKAALEAKDEPDHSDELTIAYMSGLHRGKEVAQRTWVGLTDEEIVELHHEIKVQLMGTYKTEDIYRAIEAKLKEKNK